MFSILLAMNTVGDDGCTLTVKHSDWLPIVLQDQLYWQYIYESSKF